MVDTIGETKTAIASYHIQCLYGVLISSTAPKPGTMDVSFAALVHSNNRLSPFHGALALAVSTINTPITTVSHNYGSSVLIISSIVIVTYLAFSLTSTVVVAVAERICFARRSER
jgi:hypothetical protein